MAKDLWGNDNEEFFEDRPDKEEEIFSFPTQTQVRMPPPQKDRPTNIPAEPTNMHLKTKYNAAPPQEDHDFGRMQDDTELEEDFSEVLNDANLRIEQGRLYQMIMNSDIFGQTDCQRIYGSNVGHEAD